MNEKMLRNAMLKGMSEEQRLLFLGPEEYGKRLKRNLKAKVQRQIMNPLYQAVTGQKKR